MARKPTLKSVTVNGWRGTGRTAAEARASAIENSERAAAGSYMITACSYRGSVGVVWREPFGFSYAIIRPTSTMKPTQSPCSVGPFDTREEAVRAVIRHLAQEGFNLGDEPFAPDIMTNAYDRDDFVRWARWQNAIKAYRDANPGATDEESRTFANTVI